MKRKEAQEKLNRLLPPLSCCKHEEWLGDRGQPALSILFFGHNISVDTHSELGGKTDAEIKKLISDKIRNALKETLKELEIG